MPGMGGMGGMPGMGGMGGMPGMGGMGMPGMGGMGMPGMGEDEGDIDDLDQEEDIEGGQKKEEPKTEN